MLDLVNLGPNLNQIQKQINPLQFIKKFTEISRQAQQFLSFGGMFYPISDAAVVGAISACQNKELKIAAEQFVQNRLFRIFSKMQIQFQKFDGFTVDVDNYGLFSELLETQEISFQKEGQVEWGGLQIAFKDEGKHVVYVKVGSLVVEIKSGVPINGIVE